MPRKAKVVPTTATIQPDILDNQLTFVPEAAATPETVVEATPDEPATEPIQ